MLRMGRGSKPEQEGQINEQSSLSSAPPSPGANYAAAADSPAAIADDHSHERPAPAAAATRATTDHENLARAIKDGVVGGFVGNTTALMGEANFKGMLRVDGRLSGRVTSEKGTLLVSSGGQVDAEVNVAVAKISGTVNGNINTGERLELGRTARVIGDIQTPELLIEQGAIFEGSCRMTQRPAAAQSSTPAGAHAARATEEVNQRSVPQTPAKTVTTDEKGAQPVAVTNVSGVVGNGQGTRGNVTA